MGRFIQVQIYNTAGTSVEYDNKVDTTWGISAGTASLERAIMDMELKFGDVYSSIFQVQVYGLNFDLSKRKIIVTLWEDNTSKKLFTGFINSSKTDYISTYRDLIAYDWFFENRSYNVATFWNNYWENHETATLKNFRDALFAWMLQQNIGFSVVGTIPSMLNDNLSISNSLANVVSVFNFDELLRIICELQLCCPILDGDGVLNFVKIGTTSKTLTNSNFESGNSFFEDFTTKVISGVAIYDSDFELAQIVGTDTNPYPITGNIFLLNKEASELNTIGTAMLAELDDIQYTPIDLSLIVSDLTLTLGKQIVTNKGNFYVFGEKLYGSQFVNQNIYARAQDAYLSNNVTFHNTEIIQGNKTAKIYHDIDSLKIQYTDMSRTITNNYYTKSAMDTKLEVSAEGIKSYVSANFTSTSDASAETIRINSLLQQLAEEFVFKVWADTDGQHMAMVKLGVDPSDVHSYITLSADNVNMTANDIFNILSGNVLNLGARNITIQSDNFTVTSDGTLVAINANISGLIDVTEGGRIGNFEVTSDGSIVANLAGYQAYFDNDVLELINTVTGQYMRLSYDGIRLSDATGQSQEAVFTVINGTSYFEIDEVEADHINAQSIDVANLKVGGEEVLTESYLDTYTGTYTGMFSNGKLNIPLATLGLDSIPHGMILTPVTGGAILLNYMYSESLSYGGIEIWGSDSSSWTIEGGGWLHEVNVTFSYLIIP